MIFLNKLKKAKKILILNKYLLAITVISSIYLVQLYLNNIFNTAIFILLYPAIFMIEIFLGFKVAVFSIALIGLLSYLNYGNVPHDSFSLIRIMMFMFTAFAVTYIIHCVKKVNVKKNWKKMNYLKNIIISTRKHLVVITH